MKCERCGKEYDEEIYYLCPQCFCEPTKKQRIIDYIWNIIFMVFTLAIFLLAFCGLCLLLGYNAAIVLGIPSFIIWGISLTKRKENEKKGLDTKIKKILDEPEFDNINGLKKHEIIKKIRGDEFKGLFG